MLYNDNRLTASFEFSDALDTAYVGVLDTSTAPDIDVENWPKEVIAGGDPQLERAVQEALRLLDAAPPSRLKTEPAPPTWGKRPGR